uniref:Uncharacterized protein n=1 Tax=Zea mays TaxID=4577 RepID=B6U1U9_MAIZE|nr:hypothetical protein [Zea mays]
MSLVLVHDGQLASQTKQRHRLGWFGRLSRSAKCKPNGPGTDSAFLWLFCVMLRACVGDRPRPNDLNSRGRMLVN